MSKHDNWLAVNRRYWWLRPALIFILVAVLIWEHYQ